MLVVKALKFSISPTSRCISYLWTAYRELSNTCLEVYSLTMCCMMQVTIVQYTNTIGSYNIAPCTVFSTLCCTIHCLLYTMLHHTLPSLLYVAPCTVFSTLCCTIHCLLSTMLYHALSSVAWTTGQLVVMHHSQQRLRQQINLELHRHTLISYSYSSIVQLSTPRAQPEEDVCYVAINPWHLFTHPGPHSFCHMLCITQL